MNCNFNKSLIDGYFDGELDLAKSIEVEEHLKECKECSAIFASYKSLHNSLKNKEFYFESPQHLRRKIIDDIKRQKRNRGYLAFQIFNWRNAAAVLVILLAISAGLLIVNNNSNSSAEKEITRQVVNSHLRSLISNNLTDVTSTDKHTVKPWFDGKINFSPPVNDLAASGFPLIGGRLDYINNKPAAVLVYKYGKHIINLFIAPHNNNNGKSKSAYFMNGYNIIKWTNKEMDYWAVSDLFLDKLKTFKADLDVLL